MADLSDVVDFRYVDRILKAEGIDEYELFHDLSNDVLSGYIQRISFARKNESWIVQEELVLIEYEFFRNVMIRYRQFDTIHFDAVTYTIDEKYLRDVELQETREISDAEYESLSEKESKPVFMNFVMLKHDFDQWVIRRLRISRELKESKISLGPQSETQLKKMLQQLQALRLYAAYTKKITTQGLGPEFSYGGKISQSQILNAMESFLASCDEKQLTGLDLSLLKNLTADRLKKILLSAKIPHLP